MAVQPNLDLKLSKKVEILHHLFNGKPVSPLIDGLENREVVEFQKFMWDKTVEFGIKARGKAFDRKEVTSRMVPTPNYQRMQGCSERVYYCKGTHCIHSNPNCARKKIKAQVDVMAEVIGEYMKL